MSGSPERDWTAAELTELREMRRVQRANLDFCAARFRCSCGEVDLALWAMLGVTPEAAETHLRARFRREPAA